MTIFFRGDEFYDFLVIDLIVSILKTYRHQMDCSKNKNIKINLILVIVRKFCIVSSDFLLKLFFHKKVRKEIAFFAIIIFAAQFFFKF